MKVESTLRSAAALLVLLSVPMIVRSEPTHRSRLIFPVQGKHVHSSSVVETPGGDLIACWYHGSGERRANDVKVLGSRLRKGAEEWDPVFLMADTPGLPDCNPALFMDRGNRLWLFWIVVQANRWEHSILKYRRADDPTGSGAPRWSWQDVIHLVPGESFATAVKEGFARLRLEEGMWAEYAPPYSRMIIEAAGDKIKRQTGWMPRIHPLELETGRILLPLYSDGFNVSLMAISDDGGETWRPSAPIVGLGPIQPTVVRKQGGDLVAYMRDSGDRPARVLTSTSKDDGESWSVAVDTEIPNSGSSLEVISLKSGRWAMIYNDTERGRNSLAVALSDDEGMTWKWRRHLERSPPDQRSSYSYPSLIQSRDGTLHATYSYSGTEGQSIKHAQFAADWVEGEAETPTDR